MLSKWSGKLVACLVGCLLLGGAPARADEKPDSTGPAKISLASNLGTLNLPAGYVYFGEAKTKEQMERGGSSPEDAIGLVVPAGKEGNFAVLLRYEKTGYVEDKDAGKIDPKAILESYQEGTEARNEDRKAKGLEAFHVTGWEQEPKYDAKTHVVTWSLQAKDDKGEQFVNYNTRVLTRKGVLSINLICDNADLPACRPKAQELTAKVAFNPGERYEDYQQGDKISAGGLVALIAGGTLLAKKTGLIAFLYVMAKPLLLFVKALGAKALALLALPFLALKNMIAGKKKSTEEA
ncbi:MAG: DUF2167 domain-containing protein [Candidatus Eremiobacteraeota bacterium]|nr:DUF2167 domain-containing protein [Candidatus Eremiobacteraeota bacterium]MCW5870824.1 DUF2167 domain-containing protein [Candidatus Eremiobacteraeota bacterium]